MNEEWLWCELGVCVCLLSIKYRVEKKNGLFSECATRSLRRTCSHKCIEYDFISSCVREKLQNLHDYHPFVLHMKIVDESMNTRCVRVQRRQNSKMLISVSECVGAGRIISHSINAQCFISFSISKIWIYDCVLSLKTSSGSMLNVHPLRYYILWIYEDSLVPEIL